MAVAARDRDRTAAFAAKHAIATVHSSPSELSADPDVDVVYVATPHPLHHEQALEAISAGKHVRIEKPIAMSAAAETSITFVPEARRFFFSENVGDWNQYDRYFGSRLCLMTVACPPVTICEPPSQATALPTSSMFSLVFVIMMSP